MNWESKIGGTQNKTMIKSDPSKKKREGPRSKWGVCAICTINDDFSRRMLESILRIKIHFEPIISSFTD